MRARERANDLVVVDVIEIASDDESFFDASFNDAIFLGLVLLKDDSFNTHIQ